jgi:hypothetical protein
MSVQDFGAGAVIGTAEATEFGAGARIQLATNPDVLVDRVTSAVPVQRLVFASAPPTPVRPEM